MSAPNGLNNGRYHFHLILPILLLASLVGCAPLVRAEQPAQPQRILVTAGKALEQTFVARYAGLSGVEIFLTPETGGEGLLVLRLRHGNQPGVEPVQSELPLNAIIDPGYYRFQLPPQPGSAGQNYSASLELVGNGAVQAGVAPGETYLNGALYRGYEPQDAQLTFRLVYDSWLATSGIFLESLGWLGQLAVAGLLFVLPGWGLLSRLLHPWKWLTWGEKLGLAVPVSLSIYPLFFLWTHLAGLRLGPAYAWLPPLAGLAMLALPMFQSGLHRRGGLRKFRRQFPAGIKKVSLPDLAWLALAALIFATRFWPIRSLEVPMWGDSYQHTLITQLLVENGGLFTDWSPYADLRTFTYHFGFHTLAAVFHWITRLPVPEAVLWTGQILNGLAILALYPLAVRFGRNRWAGVVAILVAGLLAPMPMFYVNWGRYTELAGLAILPAVAYLADRLLAKKPVEVEKAEFANGPIRLKEEQATIEPEPRPVQERNRWNRFAQTGLFKNILLIWLVLGGLALTHYRVLVFAVLLFPVALVFQLQPGRARLSILKTLAAGIGAGLLFLPWFTRLFSGRILRVFGGLVTTPAGRVAESIAEYNAIGDLSTYLPLAIWALAFLALAWGIWRREWGAALTGLWWLLIVLAANPHWLGLPGQGALSNFAVFIAAYLPVGILIGSAGGWAWDKMEGFSRWRIVSGWIAILLCLALGLWGARERLRDVAISQYALVTRPDLRAMGWIRENTPQSSRFLVNSFLAYGDTLVAGSDAGWWLPLLAGRETTLPPINYSSELGPRSDYLDWTNELTAAIQERGLEDPDVRALLEERGVTHVYIGQQGGRVGNLGKPLLQAGSLSESPSFRVVYHQDQVWVFEFLE